MKKTANHSLIKDALAIIQTNNLTRDEIGSLLLEVSSAAGPDSENLANATRELAELILAGRLTIREGADLFRELAEIFQSASGSCFDE